MSYRADGDALQAKVSRLEGDLAAAQETIARLEGRTFTRSAEPELTHSRWLGAPTGISLVRELDYAIDDAGYEAIAAAARARFGVQVAQVGRTLHAGPMLSITRDGGVTVVKVAASWSALAGGPIAAGTLSGLFGAMFTGAIMSDVVHASPGMILLGVASIAPALAAGAAWLARGRAKRLAERNVERYRGLFETVLELAERHAVRAPSVRARVEDGGAAVDKGADAGEEHEVERAIESTEDGRRRA